MNTKCSSIGGDPKSLGLEAVARGPRDDLARSKMELTGTVSKRRTIVVNIAQESAASVALDLGPLPLDSPVIKGLKKWPDLVLLLEPELGGVHGREGESALIARLEVEANRV